MELEGCVLPDDLLYDLELEVWVRRLTGGRDVAFGVTAPFASFVGKFLTLRFRDVSPPWRRGQSLATAETARFTGALRLPVDTPEVLERNPEVVLRPKLLNDDPYGRGWLAKLRLAPDAPLPPTLVGVDVARAHFLSQIQERRVHCYPAVPDVELFEIGSECSAVLAHLDDEIARRAPEEVILLVADDPTAPIELERWRMRSGHAVLHQRREHGLLYFLVRKEAHPVPTPRPRA